MKYNKGFVNIMIAIIIALVIGGGVVYFATKTPTSSPQPQTPPTQAPQQQASQQQQSNQQQAQIKTYKFWNKEIKYNSDVWNLVENIYCSPGQMPVNGICKEVVGLIFEFKQNPDNKNSVIIGGHQPMPCQAVQNATKCDDELALVTSSNLTEVLDFYDYLLNLF